MGFQILPNELVALIFSLLDSTSLNRISELEGGVISQRYKNIALFAMRKKTLRYQQTYLRRSSTKDHCKLRRMRFARSQLPVVLCS